jgi:ribonucleoside-diphosphate reductase alpha chain
MLAGCSSGIEPVFGIVTMKNTYVGSYHNIHWIFEEIARERGFYSEELMDKIVKQGSVQNLNEVPDDVKRKQAVKVLQCIAMVVVKFR